MLENITISKKIYVGFGFSLGVIAILGGVAVYSNTTNKGNFTEYRTTARMTNEAARVQANMLEARLAFFKFRSTQSDESKAELVSRLDNARKSIANLDALSDSEAEKKAVADFAASMDKYQEGFNAVVDFQAKRNEVVKDTLDVVGPEMRAALQALEKDLVTSGYTGAAVKVADTVQDVLEMRLRGNKFLLNNDNADLKRAEELAKESAANLSKINKSELNAEQAKVLVTTTSNLTKYTDALEEVGNIINSRNEVIDGTMNTVGPQVAAGTEDFKLELKKQQDTLGPMIQGAMESSVLLAGLLSLVGIILAGISAFFIARSITGPVGKITEAMGELADNKLDTEIPGIGLKTEIGQMADAVDVFKQNAIKVRELNAQEAAMQAKTADLQSGISVVVDAAVAGDFSKRITKKYDDPGLDQFASSVNELVASVDQGVSATSKVVMALADGNLTESMNGTFHGAFLTLQDNVNAAMKNMHAALSDVRSASDSIRNNAAEMSDAANDLSRRSEQQAASLEETSSAMEEITTAVQQSTERASEASLMVADVRGATEKSNIIVQDAVAAMGRIEQASNEIGNIINVIDEIAFQTNLLALNAGVEAARAGDAGKGFAVVAQEVRELAQRSATAARDIKDLITRSGEEVTSGVKLVTQTGEALEQIKTQIEGVNDHVNSIAQSSQEQSTGLREINTAVGDMDQSTQKNAAMVEETSAATSRLSGEADSLAELIGRFKLHSGSASVQIAKPDAKPVASPARSLGKKLAAAVVGNTAIADEWQEF